MGRSQAVRQRVLVPRSQVRILAPQLVSARHGRSSLAAIVMAGGLGTRMKSAVPKHFHPLLGRRMVDWVIEAGRGGRRRPARRRRLAGDARPVRRERCRRSPCRSSRSAPATRSARRARRSQGYDGDVLVLSGDTPLLTRRAAARARRRRTGARRRTRRSSAPSRPTRASTAASSATPTAASRASSRGPTRRRRSSGSARSTRSIYVFRADGALARARAARSRRTCRASSTSPTRSRSSSRAGEKVAAHIAADSPRDRRREHARRARAARPPSCATASTSGTCSPGVTIVDPQTTWIEPTVEIEPDVDDPPVHVLRGATRVATGAEIGANTVAIDAHVGAGRDRRPILLPSPWDGPRRVLQGGHLRGDQELTHRRPHEGAAPVVHRRRRHRRRHERRRRRDHRQLPAPARASRRAARRSAATSGPASTMASSRRSRSGTEHGSQPVRSSRRTSPPMRSRSLGRARRTRRGMQPGSATTELVLPGLEAGQS